MNLGIVDKSSAGNYTLNLSPHTRKSGFQNPNVYGLHGRRIETPVAYSILLIRDLLRNNNTDVGAARSLLEQCKIQPISRSSAAQQAIPPLNSSIFTGLNVTADHPLDILNIMARIAPWNPPFDAYEPGRGIFPATVIERLERAGLRGGQYNPPEDVNVTAAQIFALKSIAQAGDAHAVSAGNGWVRSNLIGRYGADFAMRSYIALSFYLALVERETLYPIYNGGQALEIAADQAYIFTFSSRPPVESEGFWSLTVYGEDHFLVVNPINVYALGDRSNITYPDGTRVYGDNAASDGPFQILVQPADNSPPANWTDKYVKTRPKAEHVLT